MKTKLLALWCVICGYVYKWLVDANILAIPSLEGSNYRDNKLIVSLTSYGRRIEKSIVYYSIVSILRQTVKPDKIVVCIDEKKWSDTNLPKKLLRLKEKGVEFLYCKDVRSYTKLVPALKKYPNDTIITVDDDVIYTRDTIQKLVETSQATPGAICCLDARIPIIENGYPCHYNKWAEPKEDIISCNKILPCGVGGVLYPPNSLDSLVLDEDRFLSLCPLADDIWFWYCGMLKQTTKHFVYKKKPNYSFDTLYQYFHSGSALTQTNRFEHQNDKQIRDIFDYYGIKMNEQGELTKHS